MEASILVIELVVLAIFTFGLLNYYKDSHVTKTISFAVFFSWYLGFIGMILLPRDLSDQTGQHYSTHALHTAWKTLYWMTLLMSWVVLPFLVEYCESGEIETKPRIINTCRYILRNWVLLSFFAILVAMYLFTVNHLSLHGISGLVMAASNTYGMLWIIALLGHGLVDVPLKLYQRHSREDSLRRIYFRAVQLHDDRVEASFVQEDVERDVNLYTWRVFGPHRNQTPETEQDRMFHRYMNIILQEAGMESDVECGMRSKIPMKKRSTKPPVRKEMIELHRRIRLARVELRRSEQIWSDLCKRAELLKYLTIGKKIPTSFLSCDTGAVGTMKNTAARVNWQWKLWIEPKLFIWFAAICCLCSSLIIWSEITMGMSESVAPFGSFISQLTSPTAVQSVALVVLIYMGLCSFHSLFQLKFFGKYTLRGMKNNDQLSLLNNAIYQCRLQFSLGFNFLLLVNHSSITDATAFHDLFQSMSVVRFFGTDFSLYAPLFMVILAAFTLGNGYARVLRVLGLEQHDDFITGNAEHEAKIRQGEVLIAKAIEKRRYNSSMPLNPAAQSLLSEAYSI